MQRRKRPLKLSVLNQFVDKTVLVKMTDGETATVRVNFVDVEYDDIIVDVLETSRPDRYRERMAAYTFAARDIVSAKLAE